MSGSPSLDTNRREALDMPLSAAWTVQVHPNHVASHPAPVVADEADTDGAGEE